MKNIKFDDFQKLDPLSHKATEGQVFELEL